MGDSHLIQLNESIQALIGTVSRIENTLLQILECQAPTVPQKRANPVCPDWEPEKGEEEPEPEPKQEEKPKRRAKRKPKAKKEEAEEKEEPEDSKDEKRGRPEMEDEQEPKPAALSTAEVQAKAKQVFILGGGRTVQDWRDWLGSKFDGKTSLAVLSAADLAQVDVWLDAIASGEMKVD